MEWLKLYGALLGKEDAACAHYDELLAALAPMLDQEPTRPDRRVLLHHDVRRSQCPQIRRLYRQGHPYGGRRVCLVRRERRGKRPVHNDHPDGVAFTPPPWTRTSSSTTAPSTARSDSIDELLAKSPLLADFKAVQTGNVWCITKNFYQESLALGDHDPRRPRRFEQPGRPPISGILTKIIITGGAAWNIPANLRTWGGFLLLLVLLVAFLIWNLLAGSVRLPASEIWAILPRRRRPHAAPHPAEYPPAPLACGDDSRRRPLRLGLPAADVFPQPNRRALRPRHLVRAPSSRSRSR